MLAHYLRLAPYGNGSHGIAHAARFYFDKPVEDLSWAEIALLSGLPQSPTRLNPLRPEGLWRATRRGARALDELARAGRHRSAPNSRWRSAQLAALDPQPAPRRPDTLHLVLRYEKLLQRISRPGSDPRLHATIDLDIERQVTTLARRYLAIWRGQGARAGRRHGGRARDAAPCSPIVGSARLRGRAMPARSTSRRSSARRAAR